MGTDLTCFRVEMQATHDVLCYHTLLYIQRTLLTKTNAGYYRIPAYGVVSLPAYTRYHFVTLIRGPVDDQAVSLYLTKIFPSSTQIVAGANSCRHGPEGGDNQWLPPT